MPRNPHNKRNANQNQNQNQNPNQQQPQNDNVIEKIPLVQDPQDVMSTAVRLQWNIRVLQRHDPSITTIVDQFTYAVLYRYDGKQWVKRSVEGSMFVYTRKEPPIHGFCILNREGVGNFVQPLRKGDEMGVSDDYIIYRAVDVDADDFEHFLGIWTSDLVERRHLNTFMSKIHAHVAKTDDPYSPVLLYQPLARPEDANLPLITPLPTPAGANVANQQSGAKKKQRGKQQQSSTSSPALPAAQAAVTNEPFVTVDSLFSKFLNPPATSSSNQTPEAELRGPALLQTMFASAAAAAAHDQPSGKTDGAKTTMKLSASTSMPGNVDGVAQANALKQLLGINVASSTSTPSAEVPRTPTSAPSRTGSIPPTFKPINEDEEGTPPRTPPRTSQPSVQVTPTNPSKHRNGHGKGSGPSTPPGHRHLVPYDFEDSGGPQGIVSPWGPSQRPLNGAPRPESPSPSTFPQPRALREKKGGRNNRRDGSPGQNQNQNRRGSVSNSGPPKKNYVPRNDSVAESARRIDKDVAIDVLAGAISGTEEGGIILSGGLSKETFVQELLALIHRKTDFVDQLYARYSEAMRGARGNAGPSALAFPGNPNTIDLRD